MNMCSGVCCWYCLLLLPLKSKSQLVSSSKIARIAKIAKKATKNLFLRKGRAARRSFSLGSLLSILLPSFCSEGQVTQRQICFIKQQTGSIDVQRKVLLLLLLLLPLYAQQAKQQFEILT